MRRTATTASSALVIGALVAGGAVARSSDPRPQLRGFTVTGSVSGVLPGGRVWLPATIRNPYRRRLVVSSVTVAVGRARSACSASNLDVRPFRGRVVVPPRRSRIVRVLVRMPLTAAPECNGAKFPLRFRAKGLLR